MQGKNPVYVAQGGGWKGWQAPKVLLCCFIAPMGAFREVEGRTIWIGRNSYPAPSWPLGALEPGGSLFIPMANGVDETGRTEPLIRAYITRYSRNQLIRYSVHRAEGGLVVMRSEKPHIRLARLR